MNEYSLYQPFDSGHYIHDEYLLAVINYICGNLISRSPNRSFWEAKCNYATKLQIACNWKKECRLPAMVKKGQVICNDGLVNFFADEKHKGCICSMV